MKTTDDSTFSKALAALLGPLAQAMIARGTTMREASEALKRALVEAALESDGQDASDSRVSLRTGLHRKDVKRLRSPDSAPEGARHVNALALAISHWTSTSKFRSADGTPRPLPRAETNEQPGFDDLVREIRVDMAPGTVLAALLEQGAVEALPDGTYQLLTSAFVPRAGSGEQVAAYRATLSAHLAAATENLIAEPGAPRHFDRAVRYSHLSADSIRELNQVAADKAKAMLSDINEMAHELQLRDAARDASGRFVLGSYILSKPQENGDEE